MAEYRTDNGTTVRRGPGRTIGIIVLVVAVIAAILFATGFWSADVKEGALPNVDISAKGGALPSADFDSKEVVVGTKDTTVDVPKIKTEEEKVSVPVIGVKDNGEK